jgi:hypothetical protein
VKPIVRPKPGNTLRCLSWMRMAYRLEVWS